MDLPAECSRATLLRGTRFCPHQRNRRLSQRGEGAGRYVLVEALYLGRTNDEAHSRPTPAHRGLACAGQVRQCGRAGKAGESVPCAGGGTSRGGRVILGLARASGTTSRKADTANFPMKFAPLSKARTWLAIASSASHVTPTRCWNSQINKQFVAVSPADRLMHKSARSRHQRATMRMRRRSRDYDLDCNRQGICRRLADRPAWPRSSAVKRRPGS
jgi:hypothetical protein